VGITARSPWVLSAVRSAPRDLIVRRSQK